jgi:hypothetical protein
MHSAIRVCTLLRGLPVVSPSFRGKGLKHIAAPLRLRRLSVVVNGEAHGSVAYLNVLCCTGSHCLLVVVGRVKGQGTSVLHAGLVSWSVGSTMR